MAEILETTTSFCKCQWIFVAILNLGCYFGLFTKASQQLLFLCSFACVCMLMNGTSMVSLSTTKSSSLLCPMGLIRWRWLFLPLPHFKGDLCDRPDYRALLLSVLALVSNTVWVCGKELLFWDLYCQLRHHQLLVSLCVTPSWTPSSVSSVRQWYNPTMTTRHHCL